MKKDITERINPDRITLVTVKNRYWREVDVTLYKAKLMVKRWEGEIVSKLTKDEQSSVDFDLEDVRVQPYKEVDLPFAENEDEEVKEIDRTKDKVWWNAKAKKESKENEVRNKDTSKVWQLWNEEIEKEGK